MAKVFLRGVLPSLAAIGAVTGPFVPLQGPERMRPVGWFFVAFAVLSLLLSFIPLRSCRLEAGRQEVRMAWGKASKTMRGPEIGRVVARRVVAPAGRGRTVTWVVSLEGASRWDLGPATDQADAQAIAARIATALGKPAGLET